LEKSDMVTIDDETLNLLKTVCAAGRARPSYDGASNARLEKLVDAGLLDVVNVPGADPKAKIPRRYYRPTAQAKAMVLESSKKGVA
jgi:hypothetical protein